MLEPPILELRPAERERIHAADIAAYGAMFRAGAATVGSGCVEIDGALAMWNPQDESAAYNCLFDFETAPNPDSTWSAGEAAARAGGARVFGVGITPERRGWATPDRLRSRELTHEYEELVWARHLDQPMERQMLPPGLAIHTEGLEPKLFAQVLNLGWDLPGHHGRGWLYAGTLGLPGWTHYLAFIDDSPAGGAVLCVHGGIALCMVAATDPAFRGRGIQTAFIARRLADAVAVGCDLAATETVEENASPRNFKRAGFTLVVRRDMYRKKLR